MSSSEWNATSYHAVSEPQFRWGMQVLSTLTLNGDETVLDAGCGTGRLTAVLLERLPQGKVLALDASANMLEVAAKTLAPFAPRVSFLQADLGKLTLDGVCDVVFSTATFHWVLDHDALFLGLRRALRPDGRLHAQCGGAGNLEGFYATSARVAQAAPFAEHLSHFAHPTHFADVAATRASLEKAGFTQVDTWLTPAPTPFATADAFRTFISTVVLRSVLERLPEPLRAPYLDAVTDACPEHVLDYVRLELRGHRP